MPFTFNFGNFGGFNPGGYQTGGQGAQPDFTQRPQKERKPRKPIGTPFTRTLINLAVTVLVGLVYFYVELPALNPHAEDFYFLVFLLCAVYCVCAVLTSGFQGTGARGYFGFVKKQCTIPLFVVIALIAAIAVGSIASWVVLRAGAYSKLLPLTTGDFASEVEEIRYDQIPMLDSDSAARLGSRKLGELADMVSQFEILPNYTQINYKGRPVRVTSLAYGDLIKWFTNRSNGLPAYLVIDMVTQEAEVVRLDEGMKYTTAEHFGRNLNRHLRFQYPTMMFDEPVFEIEDHHIRSGVLAVQLYLRHLTLANKRAGVRGRPVLKDDAHCLAPSGFHQRGQLIHALFRGAVLLENRGIQPHQHHVVPNFFFLQQMCLSLL